MHLDEQDLELVRGTTFDFELTWESEDDRGSLRPVNITGCRVVLQIRSESSGELLAECTSAEGAITLAAPEKGRLSVHIAPEKTAKKSDGWSDARWELRVILPSDDVYSLVRGWVQLKPGVIP